MLSNPKPHSNKTSSPWFQFHIFVTRRRKSNHLQTCTGCGVRHLILSWHLSEKLTMRKSDSPQKAFDFRKMTGDTTQISSAVVNQKPDWKGTRYCFWHHYWNNLNSWWSSRGVQIWFLLNVGAGKDLSRNQIPAYAFDLKCPHDWPYGSDFFLVVNPNLTSKRMRCKFGRPTIQIMPNHHRPIAVWDTWVLFRLEPEVKRNSDSPKQFGFQDPAWLAAWIWFPIEVLHHKPFRKGIGWTYWMKLYEMDVCNHGLCRGFGPVRVRSLSGTGLVGRWAYPGFL